MTKQTSQKKVVSGKELILLAFGVFSIFKISILEYKYTETYITAGNYWTTQSEPQGEIVKVDVTGARAPLTLSTSMDQIEQGVFLAGIRTIRFCNQLNSHC